MISNEAVSLVDRYLENRLEPEDATRLLALLEESDEVRRYFEQEAYSEYLLQSLRLLDDVQNYLIPSLDTASRETFDKATLDSLNLLQASASYDRNNSTEEPHRSSRRSAHAISYKRTFILPLILSMLFLLWGTMVFFEFNPSNTAPVETVKADEATEKDEMIAIARIMQSINAVFEEDSLQVKEGEQLDEGLIALRSGIMTIQYANGIEVVLEAPFRYRIESLFDAVCEQGRISVHVPPAGRGFTVMTPKLTVCDLGTDFHLIADPDLSELHVIEGEVRAHWLGNDWHEFKTGRGVQVENSQNVRQIVADPKKFLTVEKIAQQASERHVKEAEQWVETVDRFHVKDPSLKLRIDGTWKPERFRNLLGSSDDNQALFFTNPEVQIEMKVFPSSTSLTLMADLRINHLNPGVNTILSSVWDRPGFISWQIVRSGALQLLIQHGKTPDETWTFETPSFLTPQRQKVWYKVATVIDGQKKEVRHYLDGRLLASFSIEKDLDLVYGGATLGNVSKVRGNKENCHLNGLLRSFLLFDRALSEEEIKRLQEDGSYQ